MHHHLISIIVVTLIGCALLTLHYRWSWANPFTRRWDRVEPVLIAYVRLSPGTFGYLFVLIVTTWVLRSSTGSIDRELLLQHSTNLEHLRADPIAVLFTSAFWVTGFEIGLWLVLFPLVLAPAERWLGTVRTIGVFFIGHMTATILTAVGISFLIAHHQLPHRLSGVVDVGSSYGFWCVAALFSYRLRGWHRWAWAGSLVLGTVVVALIETEFSDFGHLVAVLTGLALYPLTRRPGPQHRRDQAIWVPAEAIVTAERRRLEAKRRHFLEPAHAPPVEDADLENLAATVARRRADEPRAASGAPAPLAAARAAADPGTESEP